MAARTRGWFRLGLAAAMLASAVGLHTARRGFIDSVSVRGPGGAAAPVLPTAAIGPGSVGEIGPASRVRVVVLDGLGLAAARRQPTLSALCDRGLDLVVDVGFPTVSLPIQSVLWSGLTQQQSGIEYVGHRLEPPLDGIPARVTGSVAIAESHGFIVESLGFASTRPRPEEVADPSTRAAWEELGFRAAAIDAVASPASLVLVHVLRIDGAGHRHGAASSEYAAAAAWADGALATLFGAAPDARWVVLADHGHLPAGGHGDAEESLRLVRACVVDAGLARVSGPPRSIHLVDLARMLADSLGVGLPAGAAGRPLAVALAAEPSVGATLPIPALGRTIAAGALAFLALVATLMAARFRVRLLPWWAIVGYAALVAVEGVPSLSTPMVWKPLGQAMYLGALPGVVVLAVVAGLLTSTAPIRLIVSQLALPAAALAGSLILCWGSPPLLPGWTAHASWLFTLCVSGQLVVGLAVLAALVPRWFDRDPAREIARGRA